MGQRVTAEPTAAGTIQLPSRPTREWRHNISLPRRAGTSVQHPYGRTVGVTESCNLDCPRAKVLVPPKKPVGRERGRWHKKFGPWAKVLVPPKREQVGHGRI